MKKIIKNSGNFFSAALMLLLIFSMSCEYNAPDEVWDPDEDLGAAPAITGMDPQSAQGGVNTIKIIGENFSSIIENNNVYFGSVKAEVMTASSNELVVYRPKVSGDDLNVKVHLPDGYVIAKYYPYEVSSVYSEYGIVLASESVIGFTVDKDENLYVPLQTRTMFLMAPDGNRTVYVKKGKSSGKYSQMRIGPEGILYVQRGNNTSLDYVPAGGTTSKPKSHVKLPRAVSFFDFDLNGNIYSGGTNSGLFFVDAEKNIASVGEYEDFDIRAVRFYDGHVYVAAYYTGTNSSIEPKAIWRNQVTSATGELGTMELVLDWNGVTDYSEFDINDLTFSEDGEIIIATNNPTDPLFMLKTDGTIEVIYKGFGLTLSADQIEWGNGQYLYVVDGSLEDHKILLRLDMGKKGAPYYGRGL